MLQPGPSGCQNGFHIFSALLCLGADPFRHFTGLGINGNLTRSKHKSIDLKSLRVGADCPWCISGFNNIHDKYLLQKYVFVLLSTDFVNVTAYAYATSPKAIRLTTGS